jgi:hypothetical protein
MRKGGDIGFIATAYLAMAAGGCPTGFCRGSQREKDCLKMANQKY